MTIDREKIRKEAYRLLQYQLNDIITRNKSYKGRWNLFLAFLYLCVQMDVSLDDWTKALRENNLEAYIKNFAQSIEDVRDIISNSVIKAWMEDNSTPEDGVLGQELSELEDRISSDISKFAFTEDPYASISLKDSMWGCKDHFVAFVILNYYFHNDLRDSRCFLIEDSLYNNIDEEIPLMIAELESNKFYYERKPLTVWWVNKYLADIEPDGECISYNGKIKKTSKKSASGMSALEKMCNISKLPKYIKDALDTYIEEVGKEEAMSTIQDYISSLQCDISEN